MNTSDDDRSHRGQGSVDLDGVYDRLGLPEDIVQSLLAQFVTIYGDFGADLQQAKDRGDMDALRERAHALKGAAGSLGLLDVAKYAGQLETDAVARRDSSIQENIGYLSAAIDDTVAAIKSLIGLVALMVCAGPIFG